MTGHSTTLVIDSATAACSVALFDDGHYVVGEYRLLGRGHAEALVPMIAALPDKGRAGRIAVALGPGSFTGVRVGLAAARALALAWNIPVYGYSTMALVAAIARAQIAPDHADVPLTVAMTGGHGEWFVETRDAAGALIHPLASLPPDAATRMCDTQLVVGTEADALVARRGWGEALAILPDARRFADMPPIELTDDLQPLYGRPPDARLPTSAAAGVVAAS